MIIEDTINAYVSPHSDLSPADLEKPSAIRSLVFHRPYNNSKYFEETGYTLVGTAHITVDLFDRNTLVSNKIDALRNEAVAIRAEATKKCTQIEGQIQQLLCIENGVEPSFASADDDLPF